MTNTKARHRQILAVATEVLKAAGGGERIDSFDQDERIPILRQMARCVEDETGCTIDTARRNVAEAMKEAYHHDKENEDRWGGARPNTGPPRLPEDQKRQQVSTRLAPGYKELAQGIAEIEGLPGWGHAVELALVKMVENDPELRLRLAEMGIIVKDYDDHIISRIEEN